jgi:hypothetical protein
MQTAGKSAELTCGPDPNLRFLLMRQAIKASTTSDLFLKTKAEQLADQQRCKAVLAQRGADAPLKPSKAQEPCDIGLFSDQARQLHLW